MLIEKIYIFGATIDAGALGFEVGWAARHSQKVAHALDDLYGHIWLLASVVRFSATDAVGGTTASIDQSD